jgi:hypothetical protein
MHQRRADQILGFNELFLETTSKRTAASVELDSESKPLMSKSGS